MPGISDETKIKLFHLRKDLPLSFDFLKKVIWYCTTKQSYIQRNSHFDNTIFDKTPSSFCSLVDSCIAAELYRILELTNIIIADTQEDIEENVAILSEAPYINYLIIQKNKNTSLLFSFNDKLRNSLAHGTFNVYDDLSAIFIGQNKAKQSSPVNFFLSLDNYDKLNFLIDGMCELPAEINDLLISTYKKYFKINKIKNSFYLRNDDAYVLFDTSFKFFPVAENKTQEQQLLEHLEELLREIAFDQSNKLFYIIAENSNSKFSKILEKYPYITIVTANQLCQHLGIDLQA